MKDLKVTKAEREKQDKDMMASIHEDDIPYGLQIHLSDVEVEKLGLKSRSLSVGQELSGEVMLRINNISDTDHGGGKKRHIGLSITAMEVESDNKMEKAAKSLYGGE